MINGTNKLQNVSFGDLIRISFCNLLGQAHVCRRHQTSCPEGDLSVAEATLSSRERIRVDFKRAANRYINVRKTRLPILTDVRRGY